MTIAFVLLCLVGGDLAARKLAFLRSLNIPGSFVGGLLGSLVLLGLHLTGRTPLEIPGELRDLLLVLFFVSTGLSTTISSWLRAGKPLLYLSVISILLMVFQNILGVAVTYAIGAPPAYGVLAGSVAFVGGLGSAIAWGEEFGARGVAQATEVAVIAATIGMVVGTFLGGPYVYWVLGKNRKAGEPAPERSATPPPNVLLEESPFIVSLLLFAASVLIGDIIRDLLRDMGLITPRFLTAMLAGLGISAVCDFSRFEMDRNLIDRCGDICLSLFVTMALCGIELWTLAKIAGPLALITLVQTAATVLFAHLFVYRCMGKNFEAAAIAGGVIGFGLSSFAVAMATVKQVERNFGPAPTAVLLTTLVGGAVSNVANALVIMGFFLWLSGS